MGNGPSSAALHKDIFKQELEKINGIITDLVNKNEKSFNKKQYNIAIKEVCESYNMMLSSQLNKHLKVDLTALKDTIYLVPKNEKLAINDTYFSKQELCGMISKHYTKIMRLLLVIKHVYDIEHFGDNSLAGITLKNIRINQNIFEIRFCDISQKMFISPEVTDKVDFAALTGFKYFSDEMLSQEERNIFIRTMRNLLARKHLTKMGEHMMCGDDLLPAKDYDEILSNIKHLKVKCNPKVRDQLKHFAATQNENMHIFVAKSNPLFHESICTDKRQLLYDLSKKTKGTKKLLVLYEKVRDAYKTNIQGVLKITDELILPSAEGGYLLRDIDAAALENIELKLKRLIAKFYFQSLVNFYALLDYSKTLKPTIVDWKDRLDYTP